ncbi:hypothetical protein CK203_094253 [Vitis vinifera]|uniref:Uncharacterized protein n=1 Tax=Vitis vinifera TaxID=29760 RepID=A0A438DD60_VITVI|nr:hypothetical protein CK203_094253 [Vitis vinifera]
MVMVILMHEQDAQPRTTIALWKANMDEAKFEDPDPAVIILDNSTSNILMLKYFDCFSFISMHSLKGRRGDDATPPERRGVSLERLGGEMEARKLKHGKVDNSFKKNFR